MSNMRYGWWSYVKDMIRRYPDLKRRYIELHSVSLSAPINGMPRSGHVSKPTEDAALRELPPTNQREYDAVRRALTATRQAKNGADRLRLIQLLYWEHGRYTLAEAALKLHYSTQAVKEWHRQFVRLVAKYYGLLDGIR